jgi:hypothetical protein
MKLNSKAIKYSCLGLGIMLTSLESISANILPEIRTTVAISKADINRITCQFGRITSIDYAAGTGLTHKTHENGKSIIFLFQQLDNGIERKLISSKVSLLVGCDSEYYSMILDPQEIESQTIFLQLPQSELSAKKIKKQNKNKSTEEIIVNLVKQSRKNNLNQDSIFASKTNNKDIYIDKLQLKLISKNDISGTMYQVKKFVVISNIAKKLDEKMFLNSKLSNHQIAAISLDDYQLNDKQKYTYLHLVINKGDI